MTHTKFRALWKAGRTLEEIAEANERVEGWKPSRSAVRKHADLLDIGSRHTPSDLMKQWRGKVRPEHHNSELRHMLEAEGRRRSLRAGEELSETDQKLVRLLDSHLFGRGRMMVVSYHPEVGFGLVPREDWDEDIVRLPRSPRLADDGLAAHSRRSAAKAPASPGPAGRDDGASPQRQASCK